MSDHRTVHQDVVLLQHQLAERVNVKRFATTSEELCILQISCKLVESLGRTAERQVKVVELLHLLIRNIFDFVLYSKKAGKFCSRWSNFAKIWT